MDLAPRSMSLMFHQPLSKIQYSRCKAWHFVITKNTFSMTRHRTESAVRAKQAKRVPAFVLCTHSQLTTSPFRSALISQANLCLLFLWGKKGCGSGVSSCERSFSCNHLVLSSDESKLFWVPAEPYGFHHHASLFPTSSTHYQDVTNPLFAPFCVIFLSRRLSRCSIVRYGL